MTRLASATAEYIYTVVLRPQWLKKIANFLICRLIPTQLRVGESILMLNPHDPVVSGALTFGVYEPLETRFFRKVCRPGMTFIDIGANLGYYTVLALQRIGDGRIVALEPDPEIFRYLQQTVAANEARNTTCVPKAAGRERGSLTLYRSVSNRGDNRLYPHEFADGGQPVEVCTIDCLLAELGIGPVDLIKVDVQGFEGHVLGGMHETIRRAVSLTILMEFWPAGLRNAGTDPGKLLHDLRHMGLDLFELSARGLVPIHDVDGMIARYPGRRYTNIVACKGAQTLAGGTT